MHLTECFSSAPYVSHTLSYDWFICSSQPQYQHWSMIWLNTFHKLTMNEPICEFSWLHPYDTMKTCQWQVTLSIQQTESLATQTIKVSLCWAQPHQHYIMSGKLSKNFECITLFLNIISVGLLPIHYPPCMSYAYSRFTDAYGLYGFSHFFMCLAINTSQD